MKVATCTVLDTEQLNVKSVDNPSQPTIDGINSKVATSTVLETDKLKSTESVNNPSHPTIDGINSKVATSTVLDTDKLKSTESVDNPSHPTIDGINSKVAPSTVLETDELNVTESVNNPSQPTIDGINSKVDTSTVLETDKLNVTESVNNPSHSTIHCTISDAAPTKAGKQKATKAFDEVAFLGPQKYVPRKTKTPDPYLHHDNYLYRKVTDNHLYRCNRWMHPILDNEWLTYNQARAMKKFLNQKGTNYDMKSCPGMLTIDRATRSATITTNHTCDMPHAQSPVKNHVDPPNIHVQGELGPRNDVDNK